MVRTVFTTDRLHPPRLVAIVVTGGQGGPPQPGRPSGTVVACPVFADAVAAVARIGAAGFLRGTSSVERYTVHGSRLPGDPES
jgi:hypothetical protein